jgi:hypothetical protein
MRAPAIPLQQKPGFWHKLITCNRKPASYPEPYLTRAFPIVSNGSLAGIILRLLFFLTEEGV